MDEQGVSRCKLRTFTKYLQFTESISSPGGFNPETCDIVSQVHFPDIWKNNPNVPNDQPVKLLPSGYLT